MSPSATFGQSQAPWSSLPTEFYSQGMASFLPGTRGVTASVRKSIPCSIGPCSANTCLCSCPKQEHLKKYFRQLLGKKRWCLCWEQPWGVLRARTWNWAPHERWYSFGSISCSPLPRGSSQWSPLMERWQPWSCSSARFGKDLKSTTWAPCRGEKIKSAESSQIYFHVSLIPSPHVWGKWRLPPGVKEKIKPRKWHVPLHICFSPGGCRVRERR